MTQVRSPNLRICAVDANNITRTYGPQSIVKRWQYVRTHVLQPGSKALAVRTDITRTYGPQSIRK